MATALQPDEATTSPTASTAATGQVSTTPSSSASSGTGGATASQSTGAAPQTAANNTANTAGASAQPASASANVNQIAGLNQNFDFSPLLNYVGQQGTNARNAYNNTQNAFTTAVGTAPTFDTNAQNTLDASVNGTAPISTAQGLLNQSYAGPTSIDSTQYMPQMQTYQQDADLTQNSNGISTLLGMVAPATTAGDRNFDATIYGQNPIYQQESQNLVNDANAVMGIGNASIGNDATAAQNAATNYQAFNTAANNYLTGEQTGLTNAFNDQVSNANNQATQLQADIPGLGNGTVDLSSIPASELAFNAQQAAPTQLTSQYGANVFNEAINPLDYLTYNASPQMATIENQATPDQVSQWNNIENILQGSNFMQNGAYQGANLSLSQNAFNTALQQAQAAMAAANATYLAGQQQPTTAAAPASTDFSEPDNSSSGGGGGDGGGGDDGGGDSGGDSGGGLAKGGFVSAKAPMLPGERKAPPPSPLAKLGRTPQPNQASNPMMGPDSSNVLNPIGQLGYRVGGQIPKSAGIPGVVDSVPIRANAGEFVTTRPSVQAAGPGNLAALNRLNTAPPSKQHMVRNALHTALSRAALAR